MGKGNGLAIVALIIALGGCGFGVYAVVILPDTIIQQASGSSEITQIWTVEQAGTFYTGSSYGDMTDMDVTITVNAGETVYVMFNAQFSNGATGGKGWLTGGVRIMMDTVEIPGSRRFFIIDSSNYPGLTVAKSITTHFIIEDLAPGDYELKVQATAQAEIGSDRVEDGLLIVYTYR
ncbi:hypothetical protein LCGC14_0626800 [marine sediment metagenome]|uniref:Uncharacterized protein n=1 Tax=marine sediment metagenome TaxID=412755 RepID=A0A0F9UBM5_9ZZZZ|nr:hypothetical protein [archaeon]